MAVSCPKCGECWEKIEGCSKMVCGRCWQNFCWGCGKPDCRPDHVFEAVCGYATLTLEKRNFFISGFMGLSDGRLQAIERGAARLNQVETKCSHCKGIYKIWCRKKINLNLRQVTREVWKIYEPNHIFHYTRRNKKHLEKLPELGRIDGRSKKQ